MEEFSIQYNFHDLRHAGASVAPHNHSGYELVYFETGRGNVSFSEEVHPFRSGMVSLTYPGTPHGESWAEDTHVWCVIFQSNSDLFDRLPEGLYSDEHGEIFPLLQAIFREQQENRPNRNEILGGYLALVLRLMARMNSTLSQQRATAMDRLDSVLYYIQDYYNTDISFAELALSIGYSYDRFRHLFKERYHISPKRMVFLKRMERAKQLLRETDEKIENIAHTCGFGSVSQFNVMFKKMRGITPKAYRAIRRQKQ